MMMQLAHAQAERLCSPQDQDARYGQQVVIAERSERVDGTLPYIHARDHAALLCLLFFEGVGLVRKAASYMFIPPAMQLATPKVADEKADSMASTVAQTVQNSMRQ